MDTIKIYRDFVIGTVQNRIYSSFVEHMGSCVYNGIYEPGHPLADARGFRKDVLELAKELNLPAIRYPGGNFTSGYNWEDSVGKDRPIRLDLAWQQIETNEFGLHEFIEWSGELGSETIMTINLGSRGPEEARNLMEYTNFPGGTYYSDKRRLNGVEKPFGFKTWCLGNELDGPWQICHKTDREYGRIATETARLMRMLDKDIELIAVGSSGNNLPSFPEWDRTVLMECYEDIDYISLHKYVERGSRDIQTYLAAPMEMEQQIKDIISTCDYVRSVKRSGKAIKLSFDEWNVSNESGRPPEHKWQIGPDRAKIEYTIEDALSFGSMMLNLIRHADRIKIACQAILVNVLPMIVADKGAGCYRSTIFYPFLHGSLYGRGESIQCITDVEKYDCKEFTDVPFIDCAAVYNQGGKVLTVFIVNRGSDDRTLDIKTYGFNGFNKMRHIQMSNEPGFCNTAKKPLTCVPHEKELDIANNTDVQLNLKAYSWNVILLM